MLTLQLKDKVIEFTFCDYFTKQVIHSESFAVNTAEQIAYDILDMAAADKKKNHEKAQSRCF